MNTLMDAAARADWQIRWNTEVSLNVQTLKKAVVFEKVFDLLIFIRKTESMVLNCSILQTDLRHKNNQQSHIGVYVQQKGA